MNRCFIMTVKNGFIHLQALINRQRVPPHPARRRYCTASGGCQPIGTMRFIISIVIDILHQNGNRCVLPQVKFGMKLPAIVATILGCFGPAVRSHDVAATITVDIAKACAVARKLFWQFVANPLRCFARFNVPPRSELRSVGKQIYWSSPSISNKRPVSIVPRVAAT